MNRWRSMALALVACALSLVVTGCPSKDSGKTVGAYNPQPTDANVQPAWFIDSANSTGCASDNPSGGGTATWGTSATCANGNGPLLSWYGLNTQRWNCGGANAGCPKLRQNTTITFLSSQSGTTDAVYFKPLIENGAIVVLQGTLPTAAASGTTGTVTAKNRATPQLLASTFTLTAVDGGVAPALVAGELAVNATHSSRNWLYTIGSPNKLSTPLAPASLVTPSATPAEVTTWANGDAVSIYQPVNVNLAEVSPTLTDLNQSNFNNLLIVYQLNVFDPAAADAMVVGGSGAVQFLETSFAKSVNVYGNAASAQGLSTPIFANCYFSGGISFAATATANFSYGRFTGGVAGGGGAISSSNLDADLIVNSNLALLGGNLGTVYTESAKVLSVAGPVGSSSNYNTTTPVIWGPGTLNVVGAGRLTYPAGAGKAASTLTLTTLQLNGQTKYFTAITATAGGIATGNTTLSAANLDTSFGATSGCALGLGGWICNAGP